MTTNLPAFRWLDRRRSLGLSLFVLVLALLFALVPLMPVTWVLFTALKDRNQVIANPLQAPTEFHWDNFLRAWEIGRFDVYFKNSIIVAIPTVILILIFGMLAAYSLAKMNVPGKDGVFVFFLIGLMIPMSVLVIPLFYEIRALDLLNSPWALVLPQVAKMLPFAILLLHTFIRDLPSEILDAGVVDGCSHWELLRYIVVPLSTPAMVTLIVFNFMWSWNNFFLPVIVIHTDSARTLPLGLNNFRGQYVTDLPMLMAGATITFLPVLVIYLMFQRHFIQGISAGAFK